MFRFVRAATWSLAGLLSIGALPASAQTASGSADLAWYASVNVGATFGHKSDSSVSGEAGYEMNEKIDLFVEGGHIGNAATSGFEERGTKIANALGATVASAAEAVNFFDVGA